jgi:hypothetical protein
MEAYKYPIFATMYHPEYQVLDFATEKKCNIIGDNIRDEVAFRLSLMLNRKARENSNRVPKNNEEFFNKRISID